MSRMLLASIVASCLLVSLAQAQFGGSGKSRLGGGDAAGGQDGQAQTPRLKTTVYMVNHLPAADLAGVLNQVLQDGRGETRVVSEAIGNCLLVSAAAEAHDEIRNLIAQLDRPQPRVTIEAEIFHVAWFDSGKSVADSPAGTRAEAQLDLSRNSQELVARLRQLEQKGLVEVLNRLTLSAVSNQPATVHVGDRRQVVRSSSSSSRAALDSLRGGSPDRGFGGASGGPGSSVVSTAMETTGTILSVTPRVAHDGGIMLQVNLEKSFVNPRSEDSNIPAEVRSAGTMTATLQSTVSLRDGETVVLGGFSSSSKPGQSQLVMLLTGRLARPEVPAGK